MGRRRDDGRGRTGRLETRGSGVFLLALLVALAFVPPIGRVAAQEAAPTAAGAAGGTDADGGEAAVRVVHGASDAGPIDLYVDGALAVSGVAFPSVSDPLFLPAGDHDLQIVPAGAAADDAVIETTLSLAAGRAYEVAALGPLAELQANVYEVDLDPPAANRARLRLVHGAPDAGPVELAGGDGEALFPAVAYPNETEYADIEAGMYDFEIRAEDGTVALPLPETELEEGLVYDLFAVGQVADGTLAALLVTATPETLRVAGRPAAIYAGRCEVGGLEASVAALTNVATPAGEPLGRTVAPPSESSITGVPLPLDDILAEDHAVVVLASEEESELVVACGEIGGTPTEEGALIVGLRETNGSGVAGLATLAPSAIDPDLTDVSVAVVADLAGTAPPAADAAPAADGDATPAAAEDAAATPTA